MEKHPYRPANRRGAFQRPTTTPDSVFLEHKDRGPCQHNAGGSICGRGERQSIHWPPFKHTYEVKTKEVASKVKGVGRDAPVY